MFAGQIAKAFGLLEEILKALHEIQSLLRESSGR